MAESVITKTMNGATTLLNETMKDPTPFTQWLSAHRNFTVVGVPGELAGEHPVEAFALYCLQASFPTMRVMVNRNRLWVETKHGEFASFVEVPWLLRFTRKLNRVFGELYSVTNTQCIAVVNEMFTTPSEDPTVEVPCSKCSCTGHYVEDHVIMDQK